MNLNTVIKNITAQENIATAEATIFNLDKTLNKYIIYGLIIGSI